MPVRRWGIALVVVALTGAASHDAIGVTSYQLSAAFRSFDSRAPARLGSAVTVVGGLVLAGAPGDDAAAAGDDAGTARLFHADGTNHVLANPTPMAGDLFGWSLAPLAGPIAMVLIGTPGESADAGAAYLYDADSNSGNFTLCLRTLQATSPHANDHLGASVTAVGTTAFVGAPGNDVKGTDAGAILVFDASSAAGEPATCTSTTETTVIFSPAPAAGEEFGTAAAGTGDRLAVGAPYASNKAPGAGVVYLLDTAGHPIHTLQKAAPAAGDFFGLAVAVTPKTPKSDPGSVYVLVGAPLDDLMGTPDAGAAYLFDGDTGALLHPFIKKPAPAAGDRFGSSVAFVQNGAQVLVGAPGDGPYDAGSAYLFDAASGDLVQSFPNPIPVPVHGSGLEDRFGAAITARGTDVIVGAPGADNIVRFPLGEPTAEDAGVVYAFEFCDGTCATNCANGIVEPPEECDDGNTDEVACRSTCELPFCGDGTRDPGESCDGGDPGECSQGCQPDCTCTPPCGESFGSTIGTTGDEEEANCNCGSPPPNGTPCNDGNQCTFATCQQGQCVALNPMDEDIARKCGPDRPCRRVLGCHQITGCMYEQNPSACDDHDPCTRDACDPPNGDSLGCVHPREPGCCDSCASPTNDCDPRLECVPCHFCDQQIPSGCCPSAGTCVLVTPRTGSGCDDHDACTTGDACMGGVCHGTRVVCTPGHCELPGACGAGGMCSRPRDPACPCGPDAGCDDANVCTLDTCRDGSCPYDPVPGSCDDGNGCTLDDLCVDSRCAGVPVDFERTVDVINGALGLAACPSPLRPKIAMPLDDAAAFVTRAEKKPRAKRLKLLRRAKTKLQTTEAKVRKNRRLSAPCKEALLAAIVVGDERLDCLRGSQ
ncbi:MAG TPA: hypothetical protein VKA21_07205 [Candidatus Binatia bacterium]|nr:hypothetical protein [Candidatus Binatia bacterium]